ncbi:DUF4386 domain-containing protein [Nocardioides sp.]|uniref:DUF4386 domain-containing protein n=1 Tax=Nocardioides sp. TaxID=35761 RepID=UPI0035691C82
MTAQDQPTDLTRTARITGLLYLGLAITGGLGFLAIRPQLYDAGDPAATLSNVLDHELLARTGIALELGTVLTQALVAVAFFALFRSVNTLAAGAVAAFGMVNAVAIMVGSGVLLHGVQSAAGDVTVPDPQAVLQSAYAIDEQLWLVGGLFFGLWLIPMGWLVLRSGWMPAPLGWILIAGGVGYVLATLLEVLFPDLPVVADLLPLLATVGELWIISYLLVRGVRETAHTPVAA